MAADAFDQVDAFLGAAVRALAPAQRKMLFREIIREVRKRNQARITRQVGPDGTKWEPRKRNSVGRVRSTAKMMIGLRAARRMAIAPSAEGGTIGYKKLTGYIASVHHHGRVGYVDKGGPKVRYPARPLLGLSAQDLAWLRARLIDHVADALEG